MWSYWRPKFNWKNLCPILFVAPLGLFVVMQRASELVSFKEIKNACDELDYYPDIDVEYKPQNWGKVNKQIVCVDYGLDELSLIIEKRNYYLKLSTSKF